MYTTIEKMWKSKKMNNKRHIKICLGILDYGENYISLGDLVLRTYLYSQKQS